MLTDTTAEELALVLDRAAARVLRQAAILAPPVDAIRLARSLGIETATDRRQDARARYVELASARGGAPRPAILLRPEPRVERRHWAVAHEIGEQQAAAVDGVSLVANDRVLVKNQSTAGQNGIYKVVNGGSWTREADLDNWDSEVVGAIVAVTNGSTNLGTCWATTSTSGGTVGSTSITWAADTTSMTFADYAGGDFSLVPGTIYAWNGDRSGTDNNDLGADISSVLSNTSGVE